MKTYLKVKRKALMHRLKELKEKIKEKDGGDYVNTGVKILIGVVIGALILYGLYYMFGDVILPSLEERIKDMFDYNGGGYTP